MKIQTSEQANKFVVIGSRVILHTNEVVKTIGDGESETTVYEYDGAEWKLNDTRNKIIEAIIASKYSIAEELATINNQDGKPSEYAAYQVFRQFAKDTADEWFE